MKLINPFAPKIAVLNRPKNLSEKINKELEKIYISKTLWKKNTYIKKTIE